MVGKYILIIIKLQQQILESDSWPILHPNQCSLGNDK